MTTADTQWMGIRDRLLRYAARYAANEHDAEDMVHTVLLRLLKGTPPNATIDLSNTYLHNCIRNAVGDQARRRQVRDRHIHAAAAISSPAPTPEQLLIASETERALIKALVRMPPRSRTYFFEVEILDTTIDEVASMSGTTRKAVEMRLSAAR